MCWDCQRLETNSTKRKWESTNSTEVMKESWTDRMSWRKKKKKDESNLFSALVCSQVYPHSLPFFLFLFANPFSSLSFCICHSLPLFPFLYFFPPCTPLAQGTAVLSLSLCDGDTAYGGSNKAKSSLSLSLLLIFLYSTALLYLPWELL